MLRVGDSLNSAYHPLQGWGTREEATMPRTLIFGADAPQTDISGFLEGTGLNITLEIWGKGSLKDTGGSKFIDNKNQDILISPALQAVFTNEDNGETLTFGITGATHITVEDGVTTYKATGHNLLGDLFNGELVLTTGNFTYSFNAEDEPSPLTGHGQKTVFPEFLLPIL
jgi:hypothetical protein